MIPPRSTTGRHLDRIPRESGDDPVVEDNGREHTEYSPRERG